MTTSEFVEAVPPPVLGEGLLITNPWVWITALLLAILIGWLSWHFGSVASEEKLLADRSKVIDEIYKRINDKARTAAAAPRNKLTSAAHDLMEEIDKLLGPVVALTPFGKRAVALKHALDGHPVPRVHDEPHGHADRGGHDEHGDGDHGKPEEGRPHPATALSTSAHASQVNISIHGPGTAASDKGGHGKGDGHGHGRDAVRDSVIDICDYWSRATMKEELHAAQKALLRMPPEKPKAKISGGAAHH